MEKQKKQGANLQREPLYLNPGILWYKLPPRFRLAFISAFSLGLIIHLYIFSNFLLNPDGIHTIKTNNDYLYFGRWSTEFFSSLSWIYETPVVISVLALLALALCAGLTVCILDIRSSACVFLVSGFMVSFPTVACTFTFMFLADAFFIAVFLHVVAVYITKKFHYGWVIAILCIAAGLGVYQAYIGCTVTLFLLDCIVALFSDTSTKDVLKRGIAYIAIIFAGLILYRIVLAFFLWKNQTVLSSYKGISEAINSGFFDYLRALPLTYRQVIRFFWSTSYLTWPLRLLQRVIFIFAASCFFLLFVKKRIYKDPLRFFLLLCGAALLPAALNLICIICAGLTNVNMLMQYSYVFAYVFAIKLFEMTALEVHSLHFGKARHVVVLANLAFCIALIWANFCVCNTGYLALQLSMEINQSIGNRILSRLETMEDYVPGKTPIMFVNSPAAINKTGVKSPYLTEMTGVSFTLLSQYSGVETFKYLCGAEIRGASAEQRDTITSSGILDSMPVFPEKDSIQIYDGVVVIKLGQ